jgi:hypothetical protein
MRALGVAALAMVALTLAPVAPAGVKNACSLVTAADASKAVGRKVGAKKHVNVAGFNTCVYTLGKVTVTVKTRLISHGGYALALKEFSGTALGAPDIGPDAWVFFVTNGVGLNDWKEGSQLGISIVGAGGGSNLIMAALAKAARSRI